MSGGAATTSAPSRSPVRLGGPPLAFKPVTLAELTGPNNQYQKYAAPDLATLQTQVAALRTADLPRTTLPPPRPTGSPRS